jgi:hypothetical protein
MNGKKGCQGLQGIRNVWEWFSIDGKGTIDVKNRVLKLKQASLRYFYAYHNYASANGVQAHSPVVIYCPRRYTHAC